MPKLYFFLAGFHIVTVVATGILWTILTLNPRSKLKPNFRDIRAVHFGSLYLVPWFLGLGYAFDKLQVEAWKQLIFPIGLGALVFFSGIGYLFPRPQGLDPFYFWTRGWGLFFSMIGLLAVIVAMTWTGIILMLQAVAG